MKVSTHDHNVANWIAAHVARRFPELFDNPIPGVWFTGSNIWSQLYGIPSPSAEARDWDIFTLDEGTALKLVTGMGWNLFPAFQTKEKRTGNREPTVNPDRHIPKLTYSNMTGNSYSEGYCYVTPAGDVDVWVTSESGVLEEIRTYPSSSHAHCRAAFSFTDGLIMLPNEAAVHGVKRTPAPDLGAFDL